MTELCVVHLVREKNGLDPFRAFVTSYRQHAGGVEHELLIIFKGFTIRRHLDPYRALLDGLQYRALPVTDKGFDLGAYLYAAKTVDSRYFCFLNSYCVLLDNDWLEKMYRHVTRERIGVVGATGSCESYYTNLWCWKQRSTSRIFLRRLSYDFRTWYRLRSARAHFAPFPNYHVRTNGFMLARETMLKLRAGKLRTKMDCFKFESGRQGLTRQVMAMGLEPLVVGSDGAAYEKERWRESETFRSGEQRNLLIADNHTRQYLEADARLKARLTEMAWGGESPARPAAAGLNCLDDQRK